MLTPNDAAPLTAPLLGLFMLLITVWALYKCFLLITGKKRDFIHPKGLRALSYFFLILPVGGLFTGYFMIHPLQSIIQTICYIMIFFRLRSLAKNREMQKLEDKKEIILDIKND